MKCAFDTYVGCKQYMMLTCFIDGLAFRSGDVLPSNMTQHLLMRGQKLSWNWTSDFGAALVRV